MGPAVDSVLAPLFREYEEAWVAFQRSADAPMPVLESVWAKVRVTPSVAGYLAQASVPAAAAPAATEAAAPLTKASIERMLKTQMEAAVKAVKAAQGPGRRTPDTRSEAGSEVDSKWEITLDKEKPDGAGENWERNRKKTILGAFKAKKEWAKDLVKKKGE